MLKIAKSRYYVLYSSNHFIMFDISNSVLKNLVAICFLLFITNRADAQTKVQSINEAINFNVSKLKKGNWRNLKHIYVSIKVDSVLAEDKVLTIQNDVNPNDLKLDDTNLLIQVTMKARSIKKEFTIVNFNVKKKNKNELFLIHLGGAEYIID
jgi:hypothetical protein